METNPYISEKISGMGVQQAKPEGQQFQPDLPISGPSFQVTATPYGMLFSVTWEMWRDDKYGVMGEMWADMGRSNRFRQEVQAFAPFNSAFSVNTGYDAANLVATSHADLDGTTQSNRPSPDVTLSQTAIQAMQVNFDNLNDERSRPVNVAAARLLINPANRYLARELLGSSGQPQSANNDMNAMLNDDLTWGVSRYITRTQDWFGMAPMMDSDIEFMWRDRPRSRTFDDPFIEAADHTVYQRFATRVGDWRWIYGSTVGY
jgi:phage major head subunit gpT-like protein